MDTSFIYCELNKKKIESIVSRFFSIRLHTANFCGDSVAKQSRVCIDTVAKQVRPKMIDSNFELLLQGVGILRPMYTLTYIGLREFAC